MIYLYALRGCASCEYAARLMREKGLHHIQIEVETQELADKLLKGYPQMKCDTCVFGLALPFAVDVVNEKLIGAMPDLHRYIHSQ